MFVKDGSPLDIGRTVDCFSEMAREDLRKAINQVDHPILNRPFFMIHPCQTKELMGHMKSSNPQEYLRCWLSTVAILLDLKLDR